MLSCCLKCRKNTESKNPKVVRTKSGRVMLLSKFSVCNSKKSKLLQERINKWFHKKKTTGFRYISLIGPLLKVLTS